MLNCNKKIAPLIFFTSLLAVAGVGFVGNCIGDSNKDPFLGPEFCKVNKYASYFLLAFGASFAIAATAYDYKQSKALTDNQSSDKGDLGLEMAMRIIMLIAAITPIYVVSLCPDQSSKLDVLTLVGGAVSGVALFKPRRLHAASAASRPIAMRTEPVWRGPDLEQGADAEQALLGGRGAA